MRDNFFPMAKAMYNAHTLYKGGKKEIVLWDDLPFDEKAAWEEAAITAYHYVESWLKED